MTIFVTTLSLSLAGQLKDDLEQQGFSFTYPPYTIFCAVKPGVSCTFYQSGKLTVQGKNKEEFILYYLEPQILQNTAFSAPLRDIDLTPHIGSDETGKGDFFGPLCVAAVYGDKQIIEELIKLGVKDSKQLTDPFMLTLAPKIQALTACKVITIFPSKYNQMYEQMQNLNHLLAWAHAAAVSDLYLKTQCPHILVDQFSQAPLVQQSLIKKGLRLEVKQQPKAESDPLVAAASILARASFLQGMEKLSQEAGIILPKGASSKVITMGKKLVELKGKEALGQFGKIHFKTAQEIVM